VRFQFDQRVTAQAFHARILWLMGFPDRACATVEAAIAHAVSIGHELSLCNTIGQACPVLLVSGNLAAAERYSEMLLDHSAKNGLALWNAWARCLKGIILSRRGDASAGLHVLQSVLAEVAEIRSLPRYLALLGELADALGRAGEVQKVLDT